MFCLGFILFWTVWISWTWVAISFHMLGTFSTIISSSIFSFPFFLSSSSGTPMTQMLKCLTLSQRSQRLSSFLFTIFFPLCFIYFEHYTTLLILSSASVILLLVPFRVFLISVIALCIIDQLFFIYSRCFSNISYIFSILVSPYL